MQYMYSVLVHRDHSRLKQLELLFSIVTIDFQTVSLIRSIDDSVKGGLTQFWELFTMIPCAPTVISLFEDIIEDTDVSN